MLHEGALRVAADGANPVRTRLAAYALRELMDDLEREAGFTRQAPTLKERVGKLRKEWSVAQRSFDVGSDGRGTGFARTLDEFFVSFEADYPKRRDQASATIGRLDPAKRGRHPPFEARKRLDAVQDYFNERSSRQRPR